jgi:excisionase family DNA binding protein
MVDPHVAYTVPQAHEITHLPRDLLYRALEDGRLRGVRRGRRWIVGGSALITFVESLGDIDRGSA